MRTAGLFTSFIVPRPESSNPKRSVFNSRMWSRRYNSVRHLPHARAHREPRLVSAGYVTFLTQKAPPYFCSHDSLDGGGIFLPSVELSCKVLFLACSSACSRRLRWGSLLLVQPPLGYGPLCFATLSSSCFHRSLGMITQFSPRPLHTIALERDLLLSHFPPVFFPPSPSLSFKMQQKQKTLHLF